MTDRALPTPPPIIRPPALAPGDTIAIAALSSGLETEALDMYERGVAELTALGFRVKAAPYLPLPIGIHAAIDADTLTIELTETAVEAR